MDALTTSPEKTAPACGDSTVAGYLRRQSFWAIAALAGWFALFWPTLRSLAEYWLEDPDYSHGFLIPVIAAVVLHANRRRLGELPVERSWLGMGALALGLALLGLGVMSHTNLVERAAAWLCLAGGTGFLLGFRLLARAPFPFLYLLLAIPPPFNVLQPFRIALKGVATRITADVLRTGGYTAHAEGNVLVIGEHSLEVADACSGIRSLMAIISTAILFGYLLRCGWIKGLVLVALAVPIAVAVNVLRVVIVAVALVSFDVDLAHGFEHEAIGFIVFGVSLGMLFACARFYDWLFVWRRDRRTA